MARSLSIATGGAAVLVCLSVWAWLFTTGLGRGPLPWIYPLEVALLGITASDAALRRDASPFPRRWPWVAAGATAGLSVLGLFSIGLLVAPVALLLAATALTTDREDGRAALTGVPMLVGAAVTQAALMLSVVQLA